MKHRLMRKIADGLSSGCLRTVGRLAAGRIFAVALLGCAAMAAAPMTAMAAMATDLKDGGADAVSDEEADLEYTVEEITEGDDYDAMKKQIGDDGMSGTVQVLKMTAATTGADGEKKEVNLSGCEVTVEMNLAQIWEELPPDKDGKKTGLVSVTITPLGGKPVEKLISDGDLKTYQDLFKEETENLRLLEEQLTVKNTYKVPKDTPAVYAVQVRPVKYLTLTSDGTPFLFFTNVYAGQSLTIDLNGYSWTRPEGLTTTEPFVYVHSGGSLKITNSGRKGGVNISKAQCIFAIADDNRNIEPGEINIECGDDTVFNNAGGEHIIFAQNRYDWGFGCGTVKLSGGTLSGANSLTWKGGGISVALGTVEMSGGIIQGNTAQLGGGIYAKEVKMSGGTIKENQSSGWGEGGGGVCADRMEMSGGIIQSNTAIWGGGIYAKEVKMSGGTIKENQSSGWEKGGGGVCAEKMEMHGGTIEDNEAAYFNGGGVWTEKMEMHGGTIKNNSSSVKGGGVYADNKMEMYNGTIEDNEATSVGDGGSGGGVWTARMRLYGGEIKNNESVYAGGGVYARSMLMADGGICGNHVTGSNSQGGGGIYIATNKIGTDSIDVIDDSIVYENDGISFNMSVIGGNINDNTSTHTGGGIFVDGGAVAHIRGMQGKKVCIERNTAWDNTSIYHGFAGGGIFVEHPSETSAEKRDGEVYIYNAVITANKAKYGGGVAGCGVSNVKLYSVDGVAIYDNEVDGGTDERYGPSVDLYADGQGVIDSVMMGGIRGRWTGKIAIGSETSKKYEGVTVGPSDDAKSFDLGIYLEAVLDDAQKKEIESHATVFIQNNTSNNSGGGGVGGNGFIKLGFREPTKNSSSLELKKIINSQEAVNEEKFKFKIELKHENMSLVMNKQYSLTINGQESTDHNTGSDASVQFELGDQDSFSIKDLPTGTTYKITEFLEKEITLDGEQINRYMPTIKVYFKNDGSASSGWHTADTENSSEISGWIGADTRVEFTNTAVYRLPSTGGSGLKLYTMAGAICLMFGAGFMYRKNFRGRRV